VSGWEGAIAKYLKNATPKRITDDSPDAFTESIYVSWNDVYVAGGDCDIGKWHPR
jgi:hypothetical protein